MKIINGGEFTGERSLFNSSDIKIEGAKFFDGESPLKECRNIEVSGCEFLWKYPLWYCKGVKVDGTDIRVTARSGIWYTSELEIRDCLIESPKTFRRCRNVKIENTVIPNAEETLWYCDGVELTDVKVRGDYFGLSSSNVVAERVDFEGGYFFDGGKNITVRNSRIISKDAFWNCENVLVENCTLVGEYLGWNSKNVTLVNCTIESNQGMCYMENVTLRGCKLVNTDLAFEYCSVDAEILSHVDSVKNPISGRIVAESFGEIILEEDKIDPSKTLITEVSGDV